MDLKNFHVLLGVTGGIAAYKSVELLRLLKKAGAQVHVAMTQAAQQFVGKTTFEVLSENSVLTDLWNEPHSSVTHIDIATQAQAALVAPATANFIGKLAQGLADDALLTTLTAVTCPIMICPSMNTDMYQNIRVQRNLDILEQDGIHILDPDSGVLACKTVGTGRLPDPWFIFDRFCAMLTQKDLKGRHLLVTAGPTIEAIDPVRFVSNHSSGKMGYAIARAAEQRGAKVTLVSGPVSLDPPVGVDLIKVETCDEMAQAVFAHLSSAHIIIKVAAVADYKPVVTGTQKIKKTDKSQGLTLEMTENMDILQRIGQLKTEHQYLVGFAAETHDLEKHALGKMKKKNLDMIAANLVGTEESGFKTNTNKVKLFLKDGSARDIPLMDKAEIAHILLDTILQQTAQTSG